MKNEFSSLSPALPDFGTRQGDLWRPLFAIAEVAGGDWIDRCEAAMEAFAPEEEEDLSEGECLLRDIHTVFVERNGPEYLNYTRYSKVCRQKASNGPTIISQGLSTACR